LEKRLKEVRERKEGSISSNSWTPFTPSTPFMVSSRRITLISWIFHPKI